MRKAHMLKGEEAPYPASISPMLATLVKEPFDNPEWVYEVKWDGFRILAHIQKGAVKLLSRSGQNYTKNYLPIVEAFSKWKHDAVIDGELVLIDEKGKPNFDELQRYSGTYPLIFYAFDLLWIDGKSLLHLSLLERKKILSNVLPDSDSIKFSDHFDDGLALFEKMKEMEMEGIIAKKKESIYRPGVRSNDWLKIQTAKRQEFVVGGWSESTNGRFFRSLIFGWYNNGELHYVGHAGHGFKQAEMPKILERLKKLEVKKSPFVDDVDAATKVHWLKPELVIDVKFSTFTRIGKIRKPAVFLGFRTDKKPPEVTSEPSSQPAPVRKESKTRKIITSEDSNWPVIEKQKITSEDRVEIEGHSVRLTNVEKTLWNDITKAELIQYYHSVSNYILPHLKDRALSLHIKHIAPTVQGMYIKDMEGQQPEYAQIFSTPRKHKKKGKRDVIDYLVCNNLATLLYIINLGCIDINPWTSRVQNYLYPDFIIIDLDPSDNDFKKAVTTALAAKDVFDRYKLKVFTKTSGKTGIHLFIPCRGFTFPQARNIAERICNEIHQLVPDITTTAVDIDRRGNKLYLDPNQNDEADTVASAYSVRPYHSPTVSTPLAWKEVNSKLDAEDFTMKTILKRLQKRGDLFAEVLNQKHAIANSKKLNQLL
jgi:bifunctional non-homologous end joining protein LigD